MKKFIIIFMILVLTFCLAACDQPGAEKPENNGNTHNHEYNLVKTTDPKCEQKGQNTYKCTCGDEYSEELDAPGHDWKEWVTQIESTFTSKGTANRSCKNCTASETKQLDTLTLDQEMARLAKFIEYLPQFQSVNELTSGAIFEWACNGAGYVSSNWDPETYMVTQIYSIDTLDAFTSAYLGKTYNYLHLLEYYDYMTYVEETNQLVLVIGAYGGGYIMTMDSYEKVDDTHYKLRYFASDYDMVPIYYGNVYLVLTENGFMLESHAREN